MYGYMYRDKILKTEVINKQIINHQELGFDQLCKRSIFSENNAKAKERTSVNSVQWNSIWVPIHHFLQFVSFFQNTWYRPLTAGPTLYSLCKLLHYQSQKFLKAELSPVHLDGSRVQHNAQHIKSIFVNTYCKSALEPPTKSPHHTNSVFILQSMVPRLTVDQNIQAKLSLETLSKLCVQLAWLLAEGCAPLYPWDPG